ncbi:DUF1427 family protein [Erwinia persicina]|uniref:DUF1427 family protein n=1 Tax=Erwinia persicina TaxID=55211 RepID=UPI00177D1B70|nr:DUF1427 family protein [Erwinia persicina]
MSPLFLSLGAGVLIGLLYALLRVRSPAPPAVALVGLLGMIVGSTLGTKLLYHDATAAVPATTRLPVVAEQQALSPQPDVKQAG